MSEMKKNEILDTMELFGNNGEKMIPRPRDVPEPIYKNLVEIMMSTGILVTVDKRWVLFEGEKYNLFLFAVAVNFMLRHCKRFRDMEMDNRTQRIIVCGNDSGYDFKILFESMVWEKLAFTHIEAALFYMIGASPDTKPPKYRVDDAMLDVRECLMNGAESITDLDGHNDNSFIPFTDMVREYGVRAYKYGLIFMKIVPHCYDMNISELESLSKAHPHLAIK